VFSIYPIFFCYAFYLSMLGQLVPYMQGKHGLALGTAGLFSTLQSIGGIVAVGLCIIYLDAFNKPKVLGLLGVGFAVLMAALGISPYLLLTYILFLFIGFVNSMVNMMSNAVVSDYTMHKRSFYLNLMHGFFGLGGAIGSQITSVLSQAVDLGIVFVIFGGFAMLCMIVYSRVLRGQMRQPMTVARASSLQRLRALGKVLKNKGMIPAALAMFFNAFMAINLLYWTYSFVYSLCHNAAVAALGLTVHFVTVTFSRFLGSRFTHRFMPRWFVSIGSFISAALAMAAYLSSSAAMAIVMFGLLGIFLGNNFPQIITESCAAAPKNTAAATGIVNLGYFLATIISPPIIGAIGDILGLKFALLINSVLLIPAGFIALRFRKNNHPPVTVGNICEACYNE
jgi:fucose permease